MVAAVATIVDAVQTAGGGHRGTLGGDAQVRSLWGNCARARGAGARGGERSITHVGSPVAKSHLCSIRSIWGYYQRQGSPLPVSRVVQRAVTQVRRSPCLSLGRWTGSTTRRCHWQWTVAAAPSSEILLLAARSRVRQEFIQVRSTWQRVLRHAGKARRAPFPLIPG